MGRMYAIIMDAKNELTENGYIRHVFQTLEELENYVKKCYARGKGEDDGSPSV
jgi:hypothetical protein